jgi:hypothetical protein
MPKMLGTRLAVTPNFEEGDGVWGEGSAGREGRPTMVRFRTALLYTKWEGVGYAIWGDGDL